MNKQREFTNEVLASVTVGLRDVAVNEAGFYCCKAMQQQLEHKCDMHGDGAACPDVVVSICTSQFFEGTIQLLARNAEYVCNYCPWCGTKLQVVTPQQPKGLADASTHRMVSKT